MLKVNNLVGFGAGARTGGGEILAVTHEATRTGGATTQYSFTSTAIGAAPAAGERRFILAGVSMQDSGTGKWLTSVAHTSTTNYAGWYSNRSRNITTTVEAAWVLWEQPSGTTENIYVNFNGNIDYVQMAVYRIITNEYGVEICDIGGINTGSLNPMSATTVRDVGGLTFAQIMYQFSGSAGIAWSSQTFTEDVDSTRTSGIGYSFAHTATPSENYVPSATTTATMNQAPTNATMSIVSVRPSIIPVFPNVFGSVTQYKSTVNQSTYTAIHTVPAGGSGKTAMIASVIGAKNGSANLTSVVWDTQTMTEAVFVENNSGSPITTFIAGLYYIEDPGPSDTSDFTATFDATMDSASLCGMNWQNLKSDGGAAGWIGNTATITATSADTVSVNLDDPHDLGKSIWFATAAGGDNSGPFELSSFEEGVVQLMNDLTGTNTTDHSIFVGWKPIVVYDANQNIVINQAGGATSQPYVGVGMELLAEG